MRLDAAAETRLNLLKSARPDTWVALSSDESRIVAEAETFQEAVDAAARAGEADPLLLRVPENWNPRLL